MRNAPALHGRDHLPGGADPIPGLVATRPHNDDLPNAIGLLPSYGPGEEEFTFVFNWEGSVEGTNIGATLDSIADAMNILFWPGVGADVWYTITVPAINADIDCKFWLTSDFDAVTATFFPFAWTFRDPGDGGPEPVTWPVNAEHLGLLYAGGGNSIDPDAGDWNVGTGSTTAGGGETLISDNGILAGCPIFIGIGGYDDSNTGANIQTGNFTLRWRMERSDTPGVLLTTGHPLFA